MASKKPVNRPSVRHASHNHPLRVFKARDEDEVVCSGCELDLTGQAFKCINETYTCDACGEYGSGFTYNCSECQYDLHVGCAFIPETVEREDHEHPLTLLYNTPCKGCEDGAMFICNVCEEDMSENLWVYYCKECDYGTHVHSCAVYEDDEPNNRGGEEGEAMSSAVSRMKSLMKAEDELAAVQLEARMKRDANNAILGLYAEPKRRYYW
ncbi:Cysteine/Histidine-rich C1 domain family protein [Arabidopsis thaliana]|uniref:Cysteine/Histidine-rich C1 domain family protein n=1 Tax=Arabidopsis thaliana TaxID=3702 RepID=O64873_ARATH|nr:Cysteine/Histidine-rich C1 domain family protein [Arabidopsis thaliana]AAC16106.1 unknown protein [Arabidopsis thaliana]AEC10415.1 Cysteine/Histidine-rich C1 domain family protein [Arabidopsis thaliana]|eukprot:NP_181967.1 Cysteine/Histidine-rich C1 domain family protein [Arabidopsis thaliana]